ncbi:branched-chain amino acid ABC transporter substrate-binding protein [Mesorhizobium sp. L-8-10]|uniref:ABC transporter substrate-binding protein n=1 Tax=unclassified Mesorhizobium TaxID=325217 RepID=UPI001925BC89|nr:MULTISPECIES: ABC transporter substrate-binding protein [unclassified Mesorhizobium]BCH26551.1 branched-chain amino acid ABC transporter substrate-binding protein [Mesorhizobium sp. L-8-3]BCH34536.1 branched-chain amino acid ABC transporter substrate-binding protein [Mesorhizobium sp. L-8-10]
MNRIIRAAAAATFLLPILAGTASADVTIGVTVSSTGSGAALGIPLKNSVELWPDEVDGEKLNVIVLDDAGDPSVSTTNARRFANDDKVDVIIGSALTPASIAVSSVAAETETPHLACSPLPPNVAGGKWTFVLPQAAGLIARTLFARMQADGVKNVGYIGFSDSYGDLWVNQFKAIGKDYGLNLIADERYARPDTSVSGQVLKLVAAQPDAVFVGASGTGAALPQLALRERGFQGPIYQTHGAVTFDFLRIAGASVDNTVFASGPVMVAELQPDSSETKKEGLDYVTAYEAKFGPGTRTQFGAHIHDAMAILKKAIPEAKKKAKPGTPEFKAALRDAIESGGPFPASQGVFEYKADDHYGLDERAVVLLTAKDGKFELVK